MISSL
jgi:hypothetical protein